MTLRDLYLDWKIERAYRRMLEADDYRRLCEQDRRKWAAKMTEAIKERCGIREPEHTNRAGIVGIDRVRTNAVLRKDLH